MLSIEESILKSLLYNEEYALKVAPYLEDEYFDDQHKLFFKSYKKLFDKFNQIPSLEAIGIDMQKEKISEDEFEGVFELVETIYSTKNDLAETKWLVEETESYCRDKKIHNAIFDSINILDGTNKNLDKHAIPTLLDEALSISFDNSIGTDFFDDIDKRHELYTSEDSRVKFPLNALNELSNGGHKKKALSCILAFTNVGKSSMMCYLAGEFLKAGLNVLYISMEMAEEVVSQRIEANLLGVTTDQLEKIGKEEYRSAIMKIRQKTVGNLVVKEYPTSGASAAHFRNLIKEVKQKKKYVPDFIFVDYINICSSSRYKSLNGVNSYSYIKAIAEELRGLAVEFDVPIMTATQVNRDGAKSNDPDMTNTSESMGLPSTLDWYIAISQDEVLRENGQQMISLLKTRWGNKAKSRPQVVGVNFDLMRYSDVGTTKDISSNVGRNKPIKSKKKETEDIDWE